MKLQYIFGILLLLASVSCSDKLPKKETTQSDDISVSNAQKGKVVAQQGESEAAIIDLCAGKNVEKIKLNFFDLNVQKDFTTDQYEIEIIKGACYAAAQSPFQDSSTIWRNLIIIQQD